MEKEISIESLEPDNDHIEDIIDLFCIVDRDAAGRTYEESTVEMSEAMFFDEDEDPSDKEALKEFYMQLSDGVVVAKDEDGDIVGFTTYSLSSSGFFDELPEFYKPALYIMYGGVHPQCQKSGIGSTLLKYIEENIFSQLKLKSIAVGASKENSASHRTLQSNGFEIVSSTTDIDMEEETNIYAKQP